MVKKVIEFLGLRLFFLIVILVLLVAAVILGLMLGYGVLGGGNSARVLNPGFWHSIYDKLNPK